VSKGVPRRWDTAGWPPLVIVVGGGGVGKTTLAAALALRSAQSGTDTLVMTFDPSLRLKDALGVGEAEARRDEVTVPLAGLGGRGSGTLAASLLDARRTFDGLIERHAPDPAARQRILGNRYYQQLAGSLAGILEYMAVERLFEVSTSRPYGRIILDTPPTRQALDFLEAPQRIVGFLDSGALRIALKPWFDERGHLRATRRLGPLGRGLEGFLDRVVGLDLLRDMGEFFQAFAPLFDGFRARARRVEALLRSAETQFVLVSGPGEGRIPDTLFFARRLEEAGMHLGPIVVNRLHPRFAAAAETLANPRHGAGDVDGRTLLAWLGERDARGLTALRALLPPERPLVALPLLPGEPSDLAGLDAVGRRFELALASS
jgi:anion-transporting  ArsA/GET3 family ATPase